MDVNEPSDSPPPSTRPTPNLLVVDDQGVNRQILAGLIRSLGFRVRLAVDGESALEAVHEWLPDLVLLDILMPGMDGFEVLARLKADESTRHLPVVVISGLEDTSDVVKCLELGAADFLTKPFHVDLLRARIRNCLEEKRFLDLQKEYQQRLERFNTELELEVQRKTHELAEAHERLQLLAQAKSGFLSLIAHELRTPLTALIGAGDFLAREDTDQETRMEFSGVYRRAVERLRGVVEDALLLTHLDLETAHRTAKPETLAVIINQACDEIRQYAQDCHVQLPPLPPCAGLLHCSRDLMAKAIAGLLRSAIRFAAAESSLAFAVRESPEGMRFEIVANGLAIEEQYLASFFEIFSTHPAIVPGGCLGLGPPVADRLIRFYGGGVTVENLSPPGVKFTIRLPHAPMRPEGVG